MKKQVLTYSKSAKELAPGERILSNRQTLEVVESVEAFDSSAGVACVGVVVRSEALLPAVITFLAADTVLVVE